MGPEIVSHFVMHGKNVAETVKHMLLLLKKNMKDQELSNLYLEAIKRVSHFWFLVISVCYKTKFANILFSNIHLTSRMIYGA
jgi:hypothetical protein